MACPSILVALHTFLYGDSMSRMRCFVDTVPLPYSQKNGDTDATALGSKKCAESGESAKTQKTKNSMQMNHKARRNIKQNSSKAKEKLSPAARYKRQNGQQPESSD